MIAMWYRLLEKLKSWLEDLKYHRSKSACYNCMEASGYATMGCCGGLTGGDKTTGYLAERCLDCPYWADIPVELRKEGLPDGPGKV